MEFATLIDFIRPIKITGDAASPLTGVAIHSNQVCSGCVFVALPSVWEGKPGGEQYVSQALEQGAAVIISEQPTPPDFSPHACWVQVENAHEAVSKIASGFYPRMPQHRVAVTGTNGKTSVADFTFQMWKQAHYPCARMGTIGVVDSFGGDYGSNGYTAPTPIVLHQTLDQLAENGVEYVVLEASSHALAQHRLDQCSFDVAGFTNLTHEHLDYHGDMEAYFQAKSILFSQLLARDGVAVLNKDDPASERLRSMLSQRSVTFGSQNADITYSIDALHENGQDLTLNIFGQKHQVAFPLIGYFQVSNALCALANAILTGVSQEDALSCMAHLKSVPGRLQKVGEQVYVDYAHTPDALETALKALRPHVRGRLSVVFGCGGNRDPYKRPQMGRIASSLADVVYVTDDNPRHEVASSIRHQILEACPGAMEVGSRFDAIGLAVEDMGAGDILLIAGKGHETGQIIGDEVQPFNDAAVAEQAIAGKG